MDERCKRVVITGATAVIGHGLAERLIKEGACVTLILRDGSPANEAFLPLEGENCRLVYGDLQNLGDLKDKIEVPQDVFFHLGWMGTYGASRNDEMLQDRNVAMTLEAVQLAYALGCKTFVGAGSQAEFGPVSGKIGPETPCHPVTAYGKAKLRAGEESRILCERLSMKHVWCRFFSVFGPFDHEYTLLGSTKKKIEEKARLSFTKGEQIWDFLYREDAAKALCLAAEKGKNGAVYCVGSGEGRPLRWYLETFCRMMDPEAELFFGEVPYYEHQVMHLEADIAALQADTGFAPDYSFEDGVRAYQHASIKTAKR